MKIVLDTNIFISAILNQNSKAGTVIQEWKNNSIEIITSKELLEEIKKVLQYPKIKKIIGWNPERIQEYIDFYHSSRYFKYRLLFQARS